MRQEIFPGDGYSEYMQEDAVNSIPNIKNMIASADIDPAETADWVNALDSVAKVDGEQRAQFLLAALERHAREMGLFEETTPYSPYRNTIELDKQPPFPGDLAMEERITSIIRWNALAMVVRANRAYGEL